MKARELKNILIFLILLSAVLATSLYPNRSPFGVVSSGSMAPTLNRGDLILVLRVPFDRVGVGDIVVFRDPNNGMAIAHRVVNKLEDGRLLTKGDNETYLDQARPGPVLPPIGEDLYLGVVPTVAGHPIKIPRLGAFLLNGLPFRVILILLLALLLVPPDKGVGFPTIRPVSLLIYSFLLFSSFAFIGHMTLGRVRVGEETYYVINNTVLPLRYVVLSGRWPREAGILLPGAFVQLHSHSVDVVYSSFGWLLLPQELILRVLGRFPGLLGVLVLDLTSSLVLSGMTFASYSAYLAMHHGLFSRLSRRVLLGPIRVLRPEDEKYLVAGMAMNGVILGALHPVVVLLAPFLVVIMALADRPTLASFAFSSSLSISLGFSQGLLSPCPQNVIFLAVFAAILGLCMEFLTRAFRLYLIPGVGA